MPTLSSIAIGIAAVSSVASAGVGYVQQNRQANLQKKQATAQRKQQELQTQRERRGAIRQAQISRAQTQQTAAGSGALTGSSVAGGLGSLSSQLGSGLGYSTQQSSISGDIANFQSRINRIGQQTAGIQGILGVVQTAASFGSDYFKGQELAAEKSATAFRKQMSSNYSMKYGSSGMFT